jgi:TolB protein
VLRRSFTFLVVVLILFVTVPPVGASFPGQPARIRFMRIDSDYELFIMRTDGSSIRRVTRNKGVNDADARVSPDGSRVVFWREPQGEFRGEIYTVWADGSHLKRLTDNDDDDQVPSWSPTGDRIVFRSDRDGTVDLYTMDPDGTDVRQVTDTNPTEWLPTWSPDGAWIAFSLDQGSDFEVARIRSNGTGGVQLLTNNLGIDDLTADWSPNGARLAIWSNQDGDFDIYTVLPDGTGRRRVTTNGVDDNNAFWLPSGKRIVFNREDARDLEIHSIRPNGRRSMRLTTNRVEDYLVRLLG